MRNVTSPALTRHCEGTQKVTAPHISPAIPRSSPYVVGWHGLQLTGALLEGQFGFIASLLPPTIPATPRAHNQTRKPERVSVYNQEVLFETLLPDYDSQRAVIPTNIFDASYVTRTYVAMRDNQAFLTPNRFINTPG